MPMTPADSDLRGMDWMPLFGSRLFTSKFAAHAADAVFRAALRLWWAAWLQVPSASLPDDDAELCELAGLGRDRKQWAKMRAADALHGFVKCADGRLYHPVLAPQAIVAWERRIKERERKRDYRGQHPPTNGNGTYVPRDRTRDIPRDGRRTSGGGPTQTGTVTEDSSSFLDSGSKPRAYAPVREAEPPPPLENRANPPPTPEEIAAVEATVAKLTASLTMRKSAPGKWQPLSEAEQRAVAETLPRFTAKPLSPEQLAIRRRQAGYGPAIPDRSQLRVVGGS